MPDKPPNDPADHAADFARRYEFLLIAHEYEEDRTGSHQGALKAAPKTDLPITGGARRILRAMGR